MPMPLGTSPWDDTFLSLCHLRFVYRPSAARPSFPATVLRSPVGEPEFSTQAVDNPVETVHNMLYIRAIIQKLQKSYTIRLSFLAEQMGR